LALTVSAPPAVGFELDQLGDKIGVGAVRLDMQGEANIAGDRQRTGQFLAAVDQTVVR